MSRRVRAWAVITVIFSIGSSAHAQSSAPFIGIAPPTEERTLTVRAFPRRTLPPANRAAIPTIAPIILGVEPISEPGPSTFSACPNGQYALQIPGVDCPLNVR